MIHGAERVEPLEQWRLKFTDGDIERVYNLKWKDAEQEGDTFLRREDPLYESWLAEAIEQPLPPAKIRFDHTHSERNISFLNAHPNLRGILSIDKLSYEGIGEEEHLVFSVITQDGTEMDDDTINGMLELPAVLLGNDVQENEALQTIRQQRLDLQRQQVEESNKQYYLEECDKLDAYSEDLKEGLQRELKELKKAITEKKKLFRASTSLPLSEMLTMKDEINKLELRQKKMQREIYAREDEIDDEKERLQEEVRRKLEGNCTIQNIMVIEFEVI